MAQRRYFRLRETPANVEGPVLVEGIDPLTGAPREVDNPRAGELAPLANVGVPVAFPSIGEDGMLRQSVVTIQITEDGAKREQDGPKGRTLVNVPNTDDRIVSAADRVIALTSQVLIDAIETSGTYDEIDAPKSEQTRKPKAEKAGEES